MDQAQQVVDALVDPVLAPMIDMVLARTGQEMFVAAAARGRVEFRADADGTTVVEVRGANPLADDDADRFVGLDDELAGEIPDPAAEARPYAYDEIAQFFDSADAPDVAVVHAAAHRYHGNAGEHGSLGTVQRRAPFIAAGPGVPSNGWIDGHARTVDVAPTVAALAGVAPRNGIDRWGDVRDGLLLGRQDGRVIDEAVTGVARHVVLVLWDGLNANELAAAIDDGEAPNAAGLVARGTALRAGLLASFPSATLANHTAIGTGASPGHSGILHNAWLGTASGRIHDLLEPSQMFDSCSHLAPGVESLHEAVHRTFPGAWTGTTHEYCDRGADLSTFRALGRGERLPFARRDDDFSRDREWWERSEKYQRMSRVDETALRCAIEFWEDDHPVPHFAFLNFSLTDDAGHETGPHSPAVRAAVRDSDDRLGRVLAAIDRRGVLEATAIVLVADHGMQRTDESVTGGYAAALAGIPLCDVADGFLYLTS